MIVLRQLPHLAWLVAVWVALWGDLTVANIVGGALVAVAVFGVFPTAGPRPARGFLLVPALRFVGVFIVAVIRANIRVTRQVLSTHELHPAIVAVAFQGVSDAVVTLVANTITLTPGTLTLETRSDRDAAVLYVHALDVHDPGDVLDEVLYMKYLAVEAFGDRNARAANVNPRADAGTVQTA